MDNPCQPPPEAIPGTMGSSAYGLVRDKTGGLYVVGKATPKMLELVELLEQEVEKRLGKDTTFEQRQDARAAIVAAALAKACLPRQAQPAEDAPRAHAAVDARHHRLLGQRHRG